MPKIRVPKGEKRINGKEVIISKNTRRKFSSDEERNHLVSCFILNNRPLYFQNLLEEKTDPKYLIKAQITEPQSSPTKLEFLGKNDNMFI